MQLHRARKEFEAAGAVLVAIGQGTPANAARFKRDHEIAEMRLLVDPDLSAYAAAGTKRATFSELLGPRMVARGARRALSARVMQGRTVGDNAQLGGVLVVTPGGEIPYAHLSDDASDTPPNAEVLAAVRAATEGG